MPFKPPMTGEWGEPLLPVSTRLNVEAGDTGADYGDGVALAQEYAGAVNQFVAKQRRNVAAGIVPIHSSRTTFDGLDVFYQNQHGRQTLHMVARPGGSSPSVASLLDLIAVEFRP